MRKIAIMIGSDSDLPQCESGLEYLLEAERKGLVEVVEVVTNSVHRNPDEVRERLVYYHKAGYVDALIAGAGMVNQLTGWCDAYLRKLKNDKIVVIGVAFLGKDPAHTRAARESIIYVPGTQVVFDEYVGATGFRRACEFAAEGELPKIILKEDKPIRERTLIEALAEAKRLLNKKEVK